MIFFDFQGYRVYLGEDRTDLRRIGQYDIVDTTGFDTGLEIIRLPEPIVIEGDTIARIDEVPVIALEGELPMYRTLSEGDEGVDVEQLEAALVRLGYDPDGTVTVDEDFASQTEAMVERWQEDLGVDETGLTSSKASGFGVSNFGLSTFEDTDNDGKFDKSTIFADKLVMPEGALWHRGSLYVLSSPYLWKFTDTNDDAYARSGSIWIDDCSGPPCAVRNTDESTTDGSSTIIPIFGWPWWSNPSAANRSRQSLTT